MVTPAQCRAARGLLKWSTRGLAQNAGVAPATVQKFENGERSTNTHIVSGLQATLEAAGIVFVKQGSDAQATPREVKLSDGSIVRLEK